MIRLLGLLWIALVIAPAAAAQDLQSVQVTVRPAANGFIADFHFPRAAPAWGFFRSSLAADGKPWRPRSWRVLTPGVTLERRGSQDALVAAPGRTVPRHVRVRVEPYTGELQSDYVPALALGGRGIALFDGHFAAYSVDAAAKLDTLPPGFDPALVGDGGTITRFRGRGLRLAGDLAGYRAGRSAGIYALYNVATASVADGVATVIDTELPAWIATDLTAFTPRVVATLTEGLGPAAIPGPTILAAWEGAARRGASMNGGTIKGLILIRMEGQGALTANPALSDLAHWFIAHEASHFWLGDTVAYDGPRDSWITEGGADLLAIRTVERLNPGFDGRAKLNEALRDCAALADEPVATALERGEQRAYYACGAVFALAAEKASARHAFEFYRQLIDASRVDGKLSRAEWLAAVPDPAVAGSIRSLVDKGAGDPKAALAELLRQAGLPLALATDGVPQLQ